MSREKKTLASTTHKAELIRNARHTGVLPRYLHGNCFAGGQCFTERIVTLQSRCWSANPAPKTSIPSAEIGQR